MVSHVSTLFITTFLSSFKGINILVDEDIDGVPIGKLTDQLDNTNKNKTMLTATTSNSSSRSFIPSKWETVDPEQIEAQAITTSKWDTLDAIATTTSVENTENATPAETSISKSLSTAGTKSFKYYDNSSVEDDHEDDADYRHDHNRKLNIQNKNKNDKDNARSPTDHNKSDEETYSFNKAKRKQIKKEVELKVLEYRDELETGKQPLRSGWTMSEQLEYYRKRLLKQVRSTR